MNTKAKQLSNFQQTWAELEILMLLAFIVIIAI